MDQLTTDLWSYFDMFLHPDERATLSQASSNLNRLLWTNLLDSLCLKKSSPTFQNLLQTKSQRIKKLIISIDPLLTEDLNLVQSLSSLSSLEIREPTNITPEQFNIFFSPFPLKIIKFSNPNEEHLKTLSSFNQLQKLWCPFSSTFGTIESISCLTSLTYLNLTYCDEIKDISSLSSLQKLRGLNLTGFF